MTEATREYKINYVILGLRSSPKAKRDRTFTVCQTATSWREAVRKCRSVLSPARRRCFRLVSAFDRRGPGEALGGWNLLICAGRYNEGWYLYDGQPRITAPRPAAGAGARRCDVARSDAP